eukprot:GHVS01001757.1.p1 GENE.GHVS01001757.1~~GHVS01001757.1.p1  ORF type:complete len:346 (+),score=22.50 GHVS01001757.1:1074-2111(+)
MPKDHQDEPEVIKCSRQNNSDLFLSVLSGLGSVAIITSVVLRLRPNSAIRIFQSPVSLHSLLSSTTSSFPSTFQCTALGARVRTHAHYRLWWWPGNVDRVVEWRAEEEMGGERRGLIQGLLTDWVPNTFYQSIYILWFLVLESIYALSNITGSTCLVRFANWVWYQLLLNRHIAKTVDHAEAFSFDCMFRQEVTEWSIPQDRSVVVLRQLAQIIRDNPQWALHPPIEVRFTAADEAWLSPSYGRQSCWIGVLMYRAWGTSPPNYWRDFLRVFNNIMHLAGGRPHWAKFDPTDNSLGNNFKQMYPMYTQWKHLRNKMDPEKWGLKLSYIFVYMDCIMYAHICIMYA